MGEEQKNQKVPWFVYDEADSTLRLFGGLIIFGLVVGGLFVIEFLKGNPQAPIYLKEGIVLSMLAYIAGWISGSSSGKKTTNGNGRHP